MLFVSANRPVVTFDLDGVLCRPPFGINPGRNQGKSRETAGTKGLLWRTERVRYLGRRPMSGARDGFFQFARLYDCQVLSARSEEARPLTERWFARWFGVVPAISLRPSWKETSAAFKVRRVRELGSVAHFEDDPHTALWLAELIPAVFLVDWARNRWVEGRPNIHRVRQLAEAGPTLARLAGGVVPGAAPH
jgi:hypothetical protein